MEQIKLDTWEKMREFADTHFPVTASYLDRVNSREYPADAFTVGQLVSKGWLLTVLNKLRLDHPETVALLGCWVGSIVQPLHNQHLITRVYGFDEAPISIELADKFNAELVADSWRFKGVVADVTLLDYNRLEFQVNGELIETRPEWIINTSCEHMNTEWFDSIVGDQLVVIQTNDSEQYDGHVNVCKSIEEVMEKYPLKTVIYKGKIETPVYTRFMLIGYK